MELCINCEQPLNKYGTCDECNFGMNYPIATSIEQAHIDSDDHARRCDDEKCAWCDYDSSDVDYGDATPSA